jgi:uncharacterized protein
VVAKTCPFAPDLTLKPLLCGYRSTQKQKIYGFRFFFCKEIIIFAALLYDFEDSVMKKDALHHSVSKSSAAKIKISNLSDGQHEFSLSCLAHDFADDTIDAMRFPNPIQIAVSLLKSATELIVEFRVSTQANLDCDLCLTPLSVSIEETYRVFFLQKGMGATAATAENIEAGQVRPLSKSDGYLDLTEDVRETLLLALPMKITCAGGQCPNKLIVLESNFLNEPSPDSKLETEWQKALHKLSKKINPNL